MKNFSLLLLLSILFQSCFSYKTVDYNNIAIDKKQKVEVLMLNKTSVKGQLVSKNDKTMILETKDGQGTIAIEEIYDVKVRKFSFLKICWRNCRFIRHSSYCGRSFCCVDVWSMI